MYTKAVGSSVIENIRISEGAERHDAGIPSRQIGHAQGYRRWRLLSVSIGRRFNVYSNLVGSRVRATAIFHGTILQFAQVPVPKDTRIGSLETNRSVLWRCSEDRDGRKYLVGNKC